MSKLTISNEILMDVAKSVKLHFSPEELLLFNKNLEDLMELASKIDEVNTPPITNDVLCNFKFQTLDLLDEPIESHEPRFYRETINHMIMVPKFVDKSE